MKGIVESRSLEVQQCENELKNACEAVFGIDVDYKEASSTDDKVDSEKDVRLFIKNELIKRTFVFRTFMPSPPATLSLFVSTHNGR